MNLARGRRFKALGVATGKMARLTSSSPDEMNREKLAPRDTFGYAACTMCDTNT